MTFVEKLSSTLEAWDEDQEYHLIEQFWRIFNEKKTQTVGGYTMELLQASGGPNDSYGDDYEFVFTVDDVLYLAYVDYDSYEYAGNQYSIFLAEPYEVTETRYKRLARAT